jgi:RimJ/RimL family protein N-acetyltransferase
MPHGFDLEVLPMLSADAAVISRWRYSGPYAFYDGALGRESEAAQYMLDPRNGFHVVRGASGLVGFCSFGSDGRVPGGTYDDDALDIGAGMDPALVGTGHGRAFLGAVVECATRAPNARRLRATVASWNERALRASRGVGFFSIGTFRTDQGIEFTILLREHSGAGGR